MPGAPCQDLYIYYLSGHLSFCEELGAGFIGNWQEKDSSFLFFSSPARRRVEALVINHPHLTLEDEYRMSYNDWQGGHTTPLSVGRFRIAPPWLQSRPGDPDSERLDILLDPGVVFGNGMHPTTRDCLIALQTLWEKAAPATVIDLGTGTGLLALAAARLGARRVLALDINLLAIQTTRANLQRNRIQDRILAVQGKAENFVDFPADLLIANLHFAVMKQIVAAPGFLLKPWSILSGLLRSEARFIADLATRQGASISQTWIHEGIWHTFLIRSG